MPTRQELYDRIRKTSHNEVVLEEMIRLGFWPATEPLPTDPGNDIRRMGELTRELSQLTIENSQLHNVEAIRRKVRKERLAASKQKRKENKERKLREREQRAAQWKRRQENEITFLGEGYSGGLSNEQSDVAKIAQMGALELTSVGNLARCLNMSIGSLRFLAFGRRTSKTTHYQRFALKKKTGGVRIISAPMPRLKHAQRWILDNILNRIELHDAAHGFRTNCSIVTNALPHVGAAVVINLDLENFFPTITYPRIKGVFRSLGYSESLATTMAMLCSEPEIAEVEIDGETYYVAKGERFLPQGAPTSPAITNLICRGLDARLTRIAADLGFVYTRYADDITFSSQQADANVGRALRRIHYVVEKENFRVHPKKTRVIRTGRRMEVTGLVVNEKVSVPRKQLRNFRACLQQVERDGPEGKHWGDSPHVISAIVGYANFIMMVDPEKGRRFQEQISRIIEKWGLGETNNTQRTRWVDPSHPSQSASLSSGNGKDGNKSAGKQTKPPQSDNKPWWKLW